MLSRRVGTNHFCEWYWNTSFKSITIKCTGIARKIREIREGHKRMHGERRKCLNMYPIIDKLWFRSKYWSYFAVWVLKLSKLTAKKPTWLWNLKNIRRPINVEWRLTSILKIWKNFWKKLWKFFESRQIRHFKKTEWGLWILEKWRKRWKWWQRNICRNDKDDKFAWYHSKD